MAHIPKTFFKRLLALALVAASSAASAFPMTLMQMQAPNPCAGITTHRIFHTSVGYTGDLSGLTGADALCQSRANAASLGGTWKAILSTDTVDAKDHVRVCGSVYLRNGTTKVADDPTDFWDGSIDNVVNQDETGGSAFSATIFSGSTSAGLKVVGQNCSNWTSSSGTFQRGRLDTLTGWLNNGDTYACTGLRPLYCIDGQ